MTWDLSSLELQGLPLGSGLPPLFSLIYPAGGKLWVGWEGEWARNKGCISLASVLLPIPAGQAQHRADVPQSPDGRAGSAGGGWRGEAPKHPAEASGLHLMAGEVPVEGLGWKAVGQLPSWMERLRLPGPTGQQN